MSTHGPAFVKGHGTENDFVLLPDRADELHLTPAQIRAICDRRAGVGADGVIRIAPADDDHFFMDYFNSDGSTAEMCGNGARVFARFLVDTGWVKPGRIDFRTRGGLRAAVVPAAGDVCVEMGPVRIAPSSRARLGAAELLGTAVDVGNPHLVCVVDGPVADLDLTSAPGYDHAAFPAGVNVEFVEPAGIDVITMRVFERGSGETRSCGTGTVAAAAAHLRAAGRTDGRVQVRVLGGRVMVDLDGADEAGFRRSTLTGPAVLVAYGHLDPSLLDR